MKFTSLLALTTTTTTMLAYCSPYPVQASSSGSLSGSNVFSASSSEDLLLLWGDEFDDPPPLNEFDDPFLNQPNAAFWSYDIGGGGWGNGEHQTYTSDFANVRVEGGYLKIIALGDSSTGFTSARIKTQDKVEFQYGTLEANMSIPDTVSGVWPAFWIMGHSFPQVPWPDCGEVDIMEVGWKGIDNQRIYSAAHWENNGEYALYDGTYDYSVPLDEGFHIYKLDWTPTMLTTYVDGMEVWKMDISQPAPCTDCTEFHQPYFMVLNVAVGGGFTTDANCGGSSAASSSAAAAGSSGGCAFRPVTNITAPIPAEMQVDWIRLYNNGYTVLPDPVPAPVPTPQPTPSRVEPAATTPPLTPVPTPQPTRSPTPEPTPSRVEPFGTTTPQPTPRPTPAPTPQPTPSRVEPFRTRQPTPNPTASIPVDTFTGPDPTLPPPTPCPSKTSTGPYNPGAEPNRTPAPREPSSTSSSSKGGKGGKGSSKRSGKGGKGGSKSSKSSHRTSITSKEALGSSSSRFASSLAHVATLVTVFGTLVL